MVSSSLPTWLALSDGGPVADLATIVGARTLQTTTDPQTFADLLRSVRPRVAIVSTPPAKLADVDMALCERGDARRCAWYTHQPGGGDRLPGSRRSGGGLRPTLTPSTLTGTVDAWRCSRYAGARRPDRAACDRRHGNWTSRPTRCDARHARPPPTREFQLLAVLASHPGPRTQGVSCSIGRGAGQPERPADGRCPRPLAAQQDRATARCADSPRDDSWRRLSPRS